MLEGNFTQGSECQSGCTTCLGKVTSTKRHERHGRHERHERHETIRCRCMKNSGGSEKKTQKSIQESIRH